MIGLYCNLHKLEGMINVQDRKCVKKPCFNYQGETIGLYCNDHKLGGMINVKVGICVFEGCMKVPKF